MKANAAMKNSGVAWLGDIPADWQQKRAKFLFYKSQQKPVENDDVVTAFRDGEVVLRSQRRTDGFTFADKEIGYQHVDRGDLVIHAMDAFAGAIGVSKSSGKMSPVCSICKPLCQDVDTTYYAYLLRAMTKTNWLVAIAKGVRERSTDFRYGDFGNMLLPLPPLQTQKSIVAYIHEETALIDDLIAKQQHLLSLLEEKRRATITNAVTRGLNTNMELKDTGIEWLGKIPAHWELKRLKYLFTINDEALSQKTDPETEFEYVDISSVDKYEGIIKREHMTFATAPSRARRVVKDGDIILGAVRTYLEAIAQITPKDKDVIVSTGFAVLRPEHTNDSDFYSWAIRSGAFMASVIASSDGVSYPAINTDKLAALFMPLPPKQERDAISKYILGEMVKMDSLKTKIHEQIDLLKERRTALISSAVTGKVKV